MGFAEDLQRLAKQVVDRKDRCKGNEEATKHSLILPFFQVLGYDIHDPAELLPEYKAGWAANKEKVDYAIFLDKKPAFFIEAKAFGEHLENYDAQLAKYFNSTPENKVAVITDGVRYRFFTDLKSPNILDSEPFFDLNMENITPEVIGNLQSFRREKFNPAEVVLYAENLVFLNALKRKFRQLFREPSKEFIQHIAGDIYPRKITQPVVDRLKPLVHQAMTATVVEMVSQGLLQEIQKREEPQALQQPMPEVEVRVERQETLQPADSGKPGVATTEEELAGFEAICRMIRESGGDDHAVKYKDTTSYFSIQLGGPHRWFVRLHFNAPRKKLGIRLPIDQARTIAGDAVQVEEYTIAADSCGVGISDLQQLQALKPLIWAAYQRVAATVSSPLPEPEPMPAS